MFSQLKPSRSFARDTTTISVFDRAISSISDIDLFGILEAPIRHGAARHSSGSSNSSSERVQRALRSILFAGCAGAYTIYNAIRASDGSARIYGR